MRKRGNEYIIIGSFCTIVSYLYEKGEQQNEFGSYVFIKYTDPHVDGCSYESEARLGRYQHHPRRKRALFFLEGEGWLKINHIEYYPVPGELFLVPAGTRISCSTNESNPFLTYWCHFTATVGENNLFDLLITPHCIAMRNDDTIKNQFQELITQHESDGLAAPFIVKSLLFHMISRFIERSTVDPLQTASIPSVHKLYIVLQYIEKHLTEQMTVDMLSQLIHFHPKYFLHYFKSMLGVSPIVYINKKRMQKANLLLLHSDMTIAEIAEQLGMQTPYLSRMFKRFTGFSPNEFRQQHRMSQRL